MCHASVSLTFADMHTVPRLWAGVAQPAGGVAEQSAFASIAPPGGGAVPGAASASEASTTAVGVYEPHQGAYAN